MGATRFCLASSGNVYEPYLGAMGEDDALAPPGYLGASKLAAEAIARPYGALMKLSVLRLFQPYGPGQTQKLVPDLIRRVRAGEVVTVGADGEGPRVCPTFVDDVVATIQTATAQGWVGACNVAHPQAVSIREMAEAIGGVLNIQPRIERTTAASPQIQPDVSRLAGRVDFSAFTGFADGVAQVVRAER